MNQFLRKYKTPKITCPHNMKTWAKITALLATKPDGRATYEEVLKACDGHRPPNVGKSIVTQCPKNFLSYCQRNKWLVDAGREPETLSRFERDFNKTFKGV